MRPLYWIDERREWFRDALMRRWQLLRACILDEANRLVAEGQLDAPDDVFWLRPSDLQGLLPWREAAARGRARVEAVRHVDLPLSAPRDVIQDLLMRAAATQAAADGRTVFPGIALHAAVVEGQALKGDDLVALLPLDAGDQPLERGCLERRDHDVLGAELGRIAGGVHLGGDLGIADAQLEAIGADRLQMGAAHHARV